MPAEAAELAHLRYSPDIKADIPQMGHGEGIIIPYYDAFGQPLTYMAAGQRLPFCRVRLLNTKTENTFVRKKPIRYVQPPNSPIYAYLAPFMRWDAILKDPSIPLIITEGEAKGIMACYHEHATIALGGVYSFATAGGELIEQLSEFAWSGRDVVVCFDSDAMTNPNILAAEARLVDELQRKRGAKCRLARLPAASDEKVGIDDFIKQHGAGAFNAIIKAAPSLGALDAKVVALNREVAWIENEGLIYDLETGGFIQKSNFIEGSRFSTLVHIVPAKSDKAKPQQISIAKTWLKHSHAQRFSEILFRPGEGETVAGESGGVALNMYREIESMPGDVTPFLELTDFVFDELKGRVNYNLPLNLLAYKAQNPQIKVPLAFVLIGSQGSGKTLWSDIVRQAFGAYGYTITPSSMAGEFQGWLERSLFVTVNEAKGEDMLRASEQLKALISDLRRPMNEKFRIPRQVNTYAQYCITSNNHAVGAFAADDRRMIVVNVPQKQDKEYYQRIVQWMKEENGPKKLMHFLKNYDLHGWTPPDEAPLTASKYMSFTESLTPVQRLAEEMRIADYNMVIYWLAQADEWARNAELSSNPGLAAAGRATAANIDLFQVRPFYTPEELALMFPAIVQTMLGSKFNPSTPAGAISRQLRDAGVPYLLCADDPRGFKWKGRVQQYLVVSQFDEWRSPVRQSDFDRMMKQFPTYGQIKRGNR